MTSDVKIFYLRNLEQMLKVILEKNFTFYYLMPLRTIQSNFSEEQVVKFYF